MSIQMTRPVHVVKGKLITSAKAICLWARSRATQQQFTLMILDFLRFQCKQRNARVAPPAARTSDLDLHFDASTSSQIEKPESNFQHIVHLYS